MTDCRRPSVPLIHIRNGLFKVAREAPETLNHMEISLLFAVFCSLIGPFPPGRGYLDNVNLVSARRGDGVAAGWVQTCTCPPGYEGDFCERCSVGFRRRAPSSGAFSACEPCSCRGGSCDPQTGDCYSADETPGERSCSEGFYRDPRQQGTCERCPCPDRSSCFLEAGALEPQCLRCPQGTFGESRMNPALREPARRGMSVM